MISLRCVASAASYCWRPFKFSFSFDKARAASSSSWLGYESINLSEALEARKSLNEQIGELHFQVVNSAYEKVIYKEGRDIVEENELSYIGSVTDLDDARLAFRELNRKLRKASFEALILYCRESGEYPFHSS